jgi:hypothetical protein
MNHRLALALLSLALAGCGALGGTPHDAALLRWQARPTAHYLLRTREEVGGRVCGQSVEVRDEKVLRILSDTCDHPTLWTVSWLFDYAAKSRVPFERCARYEPGVGCVCRDAIEVQAEYDPATGYPRVIVTRPIWRAAWQGVGYWHYTARNGALPNCTTPFSSPGRRVVVRELRPLP